MEETATMSQNTWFKDAMKKGVILGVIHIAIFLVIYAAMPSKMTGFSYLFLIIVLNMGYSIYQGIQWRNEIGGFIDYGAAFKHCFILLLFNGLTYTVFSIIFILLDPTFPEMMAQSQFDTSLYWAQKMGAPEDALEKMRDDFKLEEMAERYNISAMPLGILIAALFYAVGALIVGLIVRKREPETI